MGNVVDRKDLVLKMVNEVLSGTGREMLNQWQHELSLAEDLKFDSLDFAELAVRLEEGLGVDVFADGVPKTMGDLGRACGSGER